MVRKYGSAIMRASPLFRPNLKSPVQAEARQPLVNAGSLCFTWPGEHDDEASNPAGTHERNEPRPACVPVPSIRC